MSATVTRSGARPPAPAGRGRLQGDGGSVLVELALIAPFLVLLVLGVFEFGTAYRNRTLLAGALRTAARSSSQGGANASSDQLALTAFYATASKMKNATLQKVIIYDAGPTSGPPPATCLSATTTGSAPYGVSGTCNVYTAAQVSSAAAGLSNFNFGCTASSNWDYKWCVSLRNRTLSSATYLGVYAEYRYTGVTTVMPVRTITMSDYAVYRMEPNA